MTLYFEEEGEIKLPLECETLAKKVVEEALDYVNCPYEDCFDPESGELTLGDIVISKEKVLSQAEEYGHSPKREYAFLIAHSVLHLTGYDHMEEEERQVMEQKQREIMERLDILR